MKQYDTVAIVGVGLIGGSIGLALQERSLAREVVGIGRRAESLRLARRCGAVTTTTQSLPRGVAGAELIVVCTPVESVVETARAAATACPAGALITDTGSTKDGIVAALGGQLGRGVRFVGSHPLAGSDQSGPQHARADLFAGRIVVLTPARGSTAADRHDVREFWSAIGAQPLEMSPAEHDRAVAATSHLPHVVAAALAAATPAKLLKLTAGGWRDTTRVAGGDVELWTQILRANRADVLKSLRQFAKVTSSLYEALESGDGRRLKRLLSEAKRKRDAVGS